jgi:hypothetical protein
MKYHKSLLGITGLCGASIIPRATELQGCRVVKAILEWGFRLRDEGSTVNAGLLDGYRAYRMLKELYVRSLDESEYQRLIGIALDTGIGNFEGHALHVRSEMLRISEQ